MNAADLANIIAINDKLIRLIGDEAQVTFPVESTTCFQGDGTRSLGWSEEDLERFLLRAVPEKFGVKIGRRDLKLTMNGWSPAVGDISIAVYTAVYKQQRAKVSAHLF